MANRNPKPKQVWYTMVARTTSGKDPAYAITKVADEWLDYNNFKAWYDEQDTEGKEIDKDILGDGLLYGPETCCFVPHSVNHFFTHTRGMINGGRSGTRKDGSVFYTTLVSNPFTKGQEYLGRFDTKEEAHIAWKTRKNELAQEVAKLVDDPKVALAIRNKFRL